MPRADFAALGGHDDAVRSVGDILTKGGEYGSDIRAVRPKRPET